MEHLRSFGTMSVTQASASSGDLTTLAVAAVNFKLPEFWAADSELWFLTIESTFRKNKITSSLTKFDHVISALPQSSAAVVRDILRAPPEDQPYEYLKSELIRRTTESEHRRLQQLLTAEELGDRKPTELLRRMEQLLGDKAPNMETTILRELFLQRLPQPVRMILSTSTTDSTATLARMADQIMDAGFPSISAVQTHDTTLHAARPSPAVEDKIAQLLSSNSRMEARMDQLTRELKDLRMRHSRSSSASRRTNEERRRSKSPAKHQVCWYHYRHGNDAKKCQPPCTFTGNGKAAH